MARPEGLDRFVKAQEGVFDQVQAELRAGRKATHWMWFIFPQLRGLGRSETARYYGLRDVAEARDYDQHPVLGPRLHHCAKLVLTHPETEIEQIMGQVDALKLRSCATLLASASQTPDVFSTLIETFYGGVGCDFTALELETAA